MMVFAIGNRQICKTNIHIWGVYMTNDPRCVELGCLNEKNWDKVVSSEEADDGDDI